MLVPQQTLFDKYLKRSLDVMQLRDRRVKVIMEYIGSIKILKSLGWDDFAFDKVRALRPDGCSMEAPHH